jgi:4-hydroxy-tetrahydrodipicolinate reductase
MNIALMGLGGTGREVESAALARGHSIAERFTSQHPLTEQGISALRTAGVDCCIDFSTPSAVLPNIRACIIGRIPIVVGTTGWHDHLPEIRTLVDEHRGALVYASNFSVGAHLYLKIIKEAARLFDAHIAYDAAVHETHHRLKKDAPSGTARTIAELLVASLARKHSVVAGGPGSLDRPVRSDELSVSSTRVGSVFGTHTVTFASDADEIELTHRALNRKGFAQGAMLAAEWVQGRQGVFTAEDVFS